MQLGCGPLGVCVHKSLLVNAAYALDGADIERILIAQISGMLRFDFATGPVIILFPLKGLHLCFCEDYSLLCRELFQGTQRCFMDARS